MITILVELLFRRKIKKKKNKPGVKVNDSNNECSSYKPCTFHMFSYYFSNKNYGTRVIIQKKNQKKKE